MISALEVKSMGKRNISLEERLRSKTHITDSCWLWRGTVSSVGYGLITIGRAKSTVAHRVSYTLLRGPIPQGLTIDHLCRNKLCVNPDHLEPVTLAENVRRAIAGTHKKVCTNGHEMAGDNIQVFKDGKRRCAACKKEKAAVYRRKHYVKIMKNQRARQGVVNERALVHLWE